MMPHGDHDNLDLDDHAKVQKYEAAIRRHRDERGDDRCHLSDGELYSALPEGDTRPPVEVAVTPENCLRFMACRQQGREYISPQRYVEQLEARLRVAQVQVESMEKRLVSLYKRIGGQSQIITRLVQKEAVPQEEIDRWLDDGGKDNPKS